MKSLVIQNDLSLKIQNREIPTPKGEEALIKLSTASLNRRDQWIREGKYPAILQGITIGSDGVGEVVKVGNKANKEWIGKKILINPNINWGNDDEVQQENYHVLGLPKNGTFSEYCIVDIDRLVNKPSHLTDIEAASLPLAGLTAYRACFSKGKIKKETKVLITGFGGGVAQFAALFAIMIKAKTYITSGKNKTITLAKEKGIIEGFNYTESDWAKKAIKQCGKFDVIIDSAGGDQFSQLVKLLNPKGRLVFYGATNGLPSTLDLYTIFWRQLSIIGTSMGSDKEFNEMIAFVELNRIIPIIGSIRPFNEILKAMDDMKENRILGKSILTF